MTALRVQQAMQYGRAISIYRYSEKGCCELEDVYLTSVQSYTSSPLFHMFGFVCNLLVG